MKECDILGVKTYSDPSYIFSGGQAHRNPHGIWTVLGSCQMAIIATVAWTRVRRSYSIN